MSTVQSGLITTEINNLIPKNSSKLWIQVNDQLQIYDFEDNQYILYHFYLLITKLNKFIGVYLIYKSQFQVCSKVNRLYIYIYPLFLSFRLFSHIDNYRILSRPPVLYSKFQLVIYFLFLNIFNPLNYESMISHLQATWKIQNKFAYSSTVYCNYFFRQIN